MHPDTTPKNDDRPIIWLRFAAAAASVLLIAALPVNAQIGLPPTPSLPATALPDMPDAEGSIHTPVGGALASIDGTQIHACAEAGADTGQATSDVMGAGSFVTSQLPVRPEAPALSSASADVSACTQVEGDAAIGDAEQEVQEATGKADRLLQKIQGIGHMIAGAFGL